MTINFECGNCGKQLATPDDKAGKTGKCPECGEPVTVPQPQASHEEDDPFDFESPAAPSPQTAWRGPTQTCPMCGSDAPSTAFNCPNCGEELRPPQRTSSGDHRFSTGNKIDVGTIISTAWERFSAQMGISIAGLLIGYFSMVGVSYAVMIGIAVAFALAQVSLPLAILAGIAGYCVLLVAQVWIGLGMCMFSLSIARGVEPDLTQIFSGGRFLGRGALCGLLVGLIFIAAYVVLVLAVGAAFAAGGMLAGAGAIVVTFLVLMWLMMSFAWTGYVLVDTDAQGVSSVFLSRDLMVGNYLSAFLLYILSQVFMLLGVLALIVGVFIAVPFVMVMFAVTYDHLSGGGPRAYQETI